MPANSASKQIFWLLLGLALIFTSNSVDAQSGYEPAAPPAPTSRQECESFSTLYWARVEELKRANDQCSDAVSHVCGQNGNCLYNQSCHGNCTPPPQCDPTQAWPALYRRCVSTNTAYQCARANANALVSQCYAQVEAYQRRQRQESASSESGIATAQQTLSSLAQAIQGNNQQSTSQQSAARSNDSGEFTKSSTDRSDGSNMNASSQSLAAAFPNVNNALRLSVTPHPPSLSELIYLGISGVPNLVVPRVFSVWRNTQLFSRVWQDFTTGNSSNRLTDIGNVGNRFLQDMSDNQIQQEVAHESINLITAFQEDALSQLDEQLRQSSELVANYDRTTSFRGVSYITSTLRVSENDWKAMLDDLKAVEVTTETTGDESTLQHLLPQ